MNNNIKAAFMASPAARRYFALATQLIVAEASGASTVAIHLAIEEIETTNRAQGMGYPESASVWATTYNFAAEVLDGKHPA